MTNEKSKNTQASRAKAFIFSFFLSILNISSDVNGHIQISKNTLKLKFHQHCLKFLIAIDLPKKKLRKYKNNQELANKKLQLKSIPWNSN